MTTEFLTKDSGNKHTFATGAVRNTAAGKGRYDLLPMSALRRVAGVYERGAVIYGDDNWRKGMSFRRCADSAMRHLCQYIEGYRDEDHLAQCAFNVLALLEFEEEIKRGRLDSSIDDMRPVINGVPPINKCEKTSGAS